MAEESSSEGEFQPRIIREADESALDSFGLYCPALESQPCQVHSSCPKTAEFIHYETASAPLLENKGYTGHSSRLLRRVEEVSDK